MELLLVYRKSTIMLNINYLPGVPCPKFVITYQVPQVSSHFSSRSSVEIALEKKFSSFYCALIYKNHAVCVIYSLPLARGKRKRKIGIAGTKRDEVTFNPHLEFSGAFFLAEIFEKVSLIPIIFGSLDFQLGNPNR